MGASPAHSGASWGLKACRVNHIAVKRVPSARVHACVCCEVCNRLWNPAKEGPNKWSPSVLENYPCN
eukprot:3973906-Amphidinium_carterae.2